MTFSFHPSYPGHTLANQPMAVDLDRVAAAQVARSLVREVQSGRPHLLVDCGRLKCLRTLGVSHVISELLVLHRAGATIWLRNTDPVLQRCLALLKLTRVFRTSPLA